MLYTYLQAAQLNAIEVAIKQFYLHTVPICIHKLQVVHPHLSCKQQDKQKCLHLKSQDFNVKQKG